MIEESYGLWECDGGFRSSVLDVSKLPKKVRIFVRKNRFKSSGDNRPDYQIFFIDKSTQDKAINAIVAPEKKEMYEKYIEYLQNKLDEAGSHYRDAIHSIESGGSSDDWWDSHTGYCTLEEFVEEYE